MKLIPREVQWEVQSMKSGHDILSLDDVREASRCLAGIAHRTPALRSRTLDSLVGAEVFLKAECFQRTGSFKFRGAYHKISHMDAAERNRGLLTFSSGNHGQAVALAAKMHGASATIVMPEQATNSKKMAVAGYGADIVFYDEEEESREEVGMQLMLEEGRTLVHPYDDLVVMAGQGTVALELLEDVGPLDLLIVCVGGGGLIAGCASAAKGLHPNTKVLGVEPETGNDTQLSMELGRRVTVPPPKTICDGQKVQTPGELTFTVNRKLVDHIVTVSDDEVLAAMVFAFERMNVVIEPSGAAALAVLLRGSQYPLGDFSDLNRARIGLTISGGNVDVERFGSLIFRD